MSIVVVRAPELPTAEPDSFPLELEPTRLERAASESFQFIWRALRRLGVTPEAAVDDAVQRVFETAARKRSSILPGRERAFFFKTALLVAAEERRRARRATALAEPAFIDEVPDSAPTPDQLLDERRRRALLDRVLDTLEPDTRVVFVLFELEGLTSPAISELLDVPVGTVASRLRRGREAFHAEAHRLRLRLSHGGDR